MIRDPLLEGTPPQGRPRPQRVYRTPQAQTHLFNFGGVKELAGREGGPARGEDLLEVLQFVVRTFATEEEKIEHVIKLNLARRHLEPWQWGQASSGTVN